MEEITKPLNERIKRSKRASVPTGLRLKPKILAAVDSVAASAGMSRTEWLRAATLRALKNWSNPLENSTIWGPCRHCGHKHDPSVHGVD